MNKDAIGTDVPATLESPPDAGEGAHEAFKAAFNFSPDALALALAEPNQEVRLWRVNEAFCALSGYSEQELTGHTPHASTLWADDSLRRSVVAHLSAGNTISELEAVLRRKDGVLIPTAFSARPVTIAGRTAFLSIRRDLRGQAEMLHQLRRSEQRWRFALEGDGGAPWDWDLTNDTVYRSPRMLSMLGIPDASHECPRSEAMTPFSPDDRDAIKASFRRLLKGLSDEVHGECNVHDQDGVPTCLSYSARVLARSPAGRAERVIGTLHDITRRKQREEEVRLQRESLAHHGRLLLLGEMAAITAHEINQPLTAIANYASVLSSALSDAPSLQELAERIEQQALRAGDVAWRTLALARRSQHEHRPIDIPALIDGTVRWFANGEYRSVRFSTQLPESLPQPTGDPIQIEQVLTNLVRNGIQAMDHLPNSAIEIDASHNAQQITIRVSDRGRGVPTKVAMDIYQPFFTTRERGIGLGLTICNSILSAHGGRLWLWCTPRPGGGTTFSFSLPCPAAPQPGPDHGATDPAANPPTATRPRP